MMLKKTAGILLLASSGLVAANDEIGFNHIGVDYLYADGNAASGDGFGLDLNVALTSYLFVTMDYNTRTLDQDSGDLELENFSGGIGGNYALNEDKTIQLFGKLTWEQFDLSDAAGGGDGGEPPPAEEECDPSDPFNFGCFFTSPNGQVDGKSVTLTSDGARGDGFGAALGIRAIVWEALELNASYNFRDYGDNVDETLYQVGAAYSFGNWVATLNYDMFDEAEIDQWSLGVQYLFGKDDGGSSIW